MLYKTYYSSILIYSLVFTRGAIVSVYDIKATHDVVLDYKGALVYEKSQLQQFFKSLLENCEQDYVMDEESVLSKFSNLSALHIILNNRVQ